MDTFSLKVLFLVAVIIDLSSAGFNLRKWLDLSLRQSKHSGYPEFWFDQTLDHLDTSDTRTFKQRYMVNPENYKENGPAFLLIGGEGPINGKWMVSQQPLKYAQIYNGILFQLEHRYYGETGPITDGVVEDLNYLSSYQALGDIIEFIVAMTNQYKINPQKWVAIGGSYSGNLATWLRYKYPELVVGALAASAPVLAKVDFNECYEVVEQAIRTRNPECADRTSEAFQAMEEKIATQDGRQELQSKTNYVIPLDEVIKNGYLTANFYEYYATVFAEAVQYNRDNISVYGIDYVCNFMTKPEQTALDNLIALNLDLNVQTIKKIETIQNSSVNWLFQTCNEFGYFQGSSDKAPVFGNQFPLEYLIQTCKENFGDEYNEEYINRAVNYTNEVYGGLNPTELTNVISVHGTFDPWHRLGFSQDLNEYSPVIIIKGSSHIQSMFDPEINEIEPQGLAEAREQIVSIIGTWINL